MSAGINSIKAPVNGQLTVNQSSALANVTTPLSEGGCLKLYPA